MKYRLKSNNLDLIHLLRFLMFAGRPGVLDRTWEFRYLLSTIYVNQEVGEKQAFDVFPEFNDKVPFQVSGIRLVERVALVTEFEETELVRLSDDAPNGFDLWILADTGELLIETDNEELYGEINTYFERISGPEFRAVLY